MRYELFSVLIGLFAHQAFFIRGEWHMRIPQIVVGHAVLAFTSFYLFKHSCDSLYEAANYCVKSAVIYIFSLFSSIVTYRALFHPTKALAGPKLAGISTFWHMYQIRDSKNFTFLQKIHEKYGTFVRTGK